MVRVTPEHEGLLLDDQVAPLTDVLAQALSLLPVVAGPAQVPVGSGQALGADCPLLLFLCGHLQGEKIPETPKL